MKDEEAIENGSGLEDLNASSEEEEQSPVQQSNQMSQEDASLPQSMTQTQLEENDDPFNYGAAAIGKDGSMVMMKNSNIFPSQ